MLSYLYFWQVLENKFVILRKIINESKFIIINILEVIFFDEELIFQVWVNLIENAIKFSKENS